MIRPTQSIKRLRSDVVTHDFTTEAVHYWGDNSKEHGRDIAAVLEYVQKLENAKLLAPYHKGMKCNGMAYLRNATGRGYTYMRRQMALHLEELAEKYYNGETTIVDEFLQLYCIGKHHRDKLKD